MQGVYFRHYALQRALALGLKGFVKNQPDDSVQVEVEGEEKDLESFLEFCHRGSPQSNVLKVDVEEKEARGFEKFWIEKEQ